MDIFFSIGPISFDLGDLVAFVSGIFIGLVIFLLLYLYAVVKSLNKGLKLRQVQEEDIDEEEIKWLIKDAENQFKDKALREEAGYGPHLLSIVKSLSKDIASKFYPQSKYPYLELTIDETLVLMKYISDRFDELLSRRFLRPVRGLTISKLLQLKDTKEKFDSNIIVKAGSQVTKIASKAIRVLNFVNPVYWFKQLVVANVTSVILVKLGVAVVAITGEETYKIYSKKVFDKDVEIESSVEDIYNDIKEAVKEEKANEKK